jgi:hypothetical protein
MTKELQYIKDWLFPCWFNQKDCKMRISVKRSKVYANGTCCLLLNKCCAKVFIDVNQPQSVLLHRKLAW